MVKNICVSAIFLVCSMLAAPGPAFALRCGNNIVDVGDSKIEVLAKCGEPTLKEEVGEDITRERDSRESRKAKRYVEKWTYNFGSTRFIYVLTIRDGKVIDISSEDKGF
jgi:hypothetical protein